MSTEGTRAAMRLYFAVLGTDRFAEAVAPDVTWAVTGTGRTRVGAREVQRHLDALHGAMDEVVNRPLVVGDGMAFLEGECGIADTSKGRIAYCVSYEIRDQRVQAMRLYGDLESAIGLDDPE